jgi:hypothetical protein
MVVSNQAGSANEKLKHMIKAKTNKPKKKNPNKKATQKISTRVQG